jgi:hypothetical protein
MFREPLRRDAKLSFLAVAAELAFRRSAAKDLLLRQTRARD